MATQETRSELITIVVAMFDATPGTAVLSDLVAASDAGSSNAQIAANLAGTAEFSSIYASFLTNEEFVNKFVNNMVGNLTTEAEKDAVKEYLVAEMNAGASRVDVVLSAVAALKAVPEDDAVWGAASTAFNNKVEVAEFHTVEQQQPTTTLADLQDVLANVDDTEASVTAAKAEIVGDATVGSKFSLTSGVDALVGTSNNDTFNAGDTFTIGDTIDGGLGNDTFNWNQSTAVTTVPVGAVVKNVENVNVVSSAAITLNSTTNFAGMTDLSTTTSGAAQTLTTAASVNVTANAGDQAATAVSSTGGNNVTVNATGVSTGTTTVSGAAGDVVVNSTTGTAGGVTQGAISVTGGKSVTVNTATGNAVSTTDTQAAVTVTGNASTTSVTVNQEAARTQTATVSGKANGAVTINDVSAASATAAGKIETVSLSNYGAATIDSSALTTVNLTGTGSTLGITAGALTTPAVTALTLNGNALTAGAVTLDSDYKTLTVDSSTKASTFANVTGTGVETLNLSGDAKLTFTAQTFAALKSIDVSNSAGVTLGTALANNVAFTGGAGADTITIGQTTKAINMGAGDDVVIVNNATLGAGGSVNGGDGTDTLVANLNGSTFSADPAFTGFETLRVAGAAAQGSHNANGFTAIEVGSIAGATTFTNVVAGVGLTVVDTTGAATTVTLANATGTNDSFDLGLSSGGAIAAGSITLAGVETVNITSNDTTPTATGTTHTNTATLVATSATSITVSGNAGLNLTNTGNTAVTSFDASGVTTAAANAANAGVTFASANTTVAALVTITGGAGNDTLTGGANTYDTINGGAGADTLVYLGGRDTFTGGAGADTFDIDGVGTKTNFLTVTDATKGDKLDFVSITTGTMADIAAGAATKVTLGAAATLDQYLDAAAAGATGGTTALFAWFQFEGNTYAVVDNSNDTTFQSGTDAVIKLSGTVDLSLASVTTEVLTFG